MEPINSQFNGSAKKTDSKFEALVRLSNLGYNLIPIDGKFPPCIKWKEYQSQPAHGRDYQQWHRQFYPQKDILNWGLLTGAKPYSEAPAIVVVDSDDAEAEALVQSHCPPTPVMQRTSKGLHRVYRRPPVALVAYIGNRQKTHCGGIIYNVDIRGDGGYILAPGSVHPETRKEYTELDPWTAELIAQAPVYDPTWLPDEVEERSPRKKPSSSRKHEYEFDDDDWPQEDVGVDVAERRRQAEVYLAAVPGTTQGTGADRACVALTFKLLWGFALPPSVAFDLLYEWGQKPDNVDDLGRWYPWSEEEIRRKIEWVMDQDYDGAVGDKLRTGYAMPPELLLPEYCGDEPPKQKATTGFQFKPMWSREFAAARFVREWWVKNLLVKGQPCILGGPKKVLKTSILLDLALSLGTGGKFLGHFPVVKQGRTVIVSGESGEATLQETALRVCQSKGIALEDTNCGFMFRLPQLTVEQHLTELHDGLYRNKVEFVIVDPLYLCLLAGMTQKTQKNAASLYDMGPLLLEVATACLDAGATPALAHHTRKNLERPHEPLELEDLAFSGVAEFARQWVLVNRRAPYQPGSGFHQLWLTVGGSFGHGGLWGLDVNEGVLDEFFAGRQWRPQILSLPEVKDQKKTAKDEEHKEKDAADATVFLNTLAMYKDTPSKTAFKNALGWSGTRFNKVYGQLLLAGTIADVEVMVDIGSGAKRKATGVRLIDHQDHQDAP